MKTIFKCDIEIKGMLQKSMLVIYEDEHVFVSRKVFNHLMKSGYIKGEVIERIDARCPGKTNKWLAVLSAF